MDMNYNKIQKPKCMGRYLKMNKTRFIKELSKKTGYDKQRCILINDIIENYFIFGRKNKEKIIQDLQTIDMTIIKS